MGQTIFDIVKTDDGQDVYEAICPHDPTIKPRAIKKVAQKPTIAPKEEKDLIAPSPIDPKLIAIELE